MLPQAFDTATATNQSTSSAHASPRLLTSITGHTSGTPATPSSPRIIRPSPPGMPLSPSLPTTPQVWPPPRPQSRWLRALQQRHGPPCWRPRPLPRCAPASRGHGTWSQGAVQGQDQGPRGPRLQAWCEQVRGGCGRLRCWGMRHARCAQLRPVRCWELLEAVACALCETHAASCGGWDSWSGAVHPVRGRCSRCIAAGEVRW
jgi:hypothetical protein